MVKPIIGTERWYCSQCNRHGVVSYDADHRDVMSVIYLLGDGHFNTSPECMARIGDLQVFNERALGNVPPEERILILQRFGLQSTLN